MKKTYIAPITNESKMKMNLILHGASDVTVTTAAHDLDNDDVNVSGMDLDNNASGTVSFGKQRGNFYEGY